MKGKLISTLGNQMALSFNDPIIIGHAFVEFFDKLFMIGTQYIHDSLSENVTTK
ncbi:unnamed protein product, partial [Dovyalis caffra]